MKTLLTFFHFTTFLTAQDIKPYRIGIIVTDLDVATTWYTTIFDVDLKEEFSFLEWGMRVNLLQNEQLKFELVSRNQFYTPQELVPDYDLREKPINGFYKMTFEVIDIQHIYNKCKEQNAAIYFELNTDEKLKIKSFSIKDPDGNVLQFVEELNKK